MQIIFDKVSYEYKNEASKKIRALDQVSLKIESGECIGVMGQTGSGKSTLIQHMNGLLKAGKGAVYYQGQDLSDKEVSLPKIRGEVGIVFQNPDDQLFEETVFSDVCFGPMNKFKDRKTAELKAFEALEKMEFPRELFYQPPYSLSGGEKRKAAIAGVLAMNPKVLILDEPAAGLDPKGKQKLFTLLKRIWEKEKITLIFVSHSMEDIAEYADRVIVMEQGKIYADGPVREIFCGEYDLERIGLDLPQPLWLIKRLKKRGVDVRGDRMRMEEVSKEILRCWKERH